MCFGNTDAFRLELEGSTQSNALCSRMSKFLTGRNTYSKQHNDIKCSGYLCDPYFLKKLYLYIFIANNHEQFYLMFYMGYSDNQFHSHQAQKHSQSQKGILLFIIIKNKSTKTVLLLQQSIRNFKARMPRGVQFILKIASLQIFFLRKKRLFRLHQINQNKRLKRAHDKSSP